MSHSKVEKKTSCLLGYFSLTYTCGTVAARGRGGGGWAGGGEGGRGRGEGSHVYGRILPA